MIQPELKPLLEKINLLEKQVKNLQTDVKDLKQNPRVIYSGEYREL